MEKIEIREVGATQEGFLLRKHLEVVVLFSLTHFYKSATCQALYLAPGYQQGGGGELDIQVWDG